MLRSVGMPADRYCFLPRLSLLCGRARCPSWRLSLPRLCTTCSISPPSGVSGKRTSTRSVWTSRARAPWKRAWSLTSRCVCGGVPRSLPIGDAGSLPPAFSLPPVTPAGLHLLPDACDPCSSLPLISLLTRPPGRAHGGGERVLLRAGGAAGDGAQAHVHQGAAADIGHPLEAIRVRPPLHAEVGILHSTWWFGCTL